MFTGLFDLKKPGEYPYLTMGEHAIEDGNYELQRGHPPYGELGREIEFHELPVNYQEFVRKVYQELWSLSA